MNIKHVFKKGKRIRRILAYCLTFILLCNLSAFVFASEEPVSPTSIEETVEAPSPEPIVSEPAPAPAPEAAPVSEPAPEPVMDASTEPINLPSTDQIEDIIAKDVTEDADSTDLGESKGIVSSTKEENPEAIDLRGEEDIMPMALSGPQEMYVGDTITIEAEKGDEENRDRHRWTVSPDTGIVSHSYPDKNNYRKLSLTGLSAGTVTIKHEYRDKSWKEEGTYTVTVREHAPNDPVKVYVYVATRDINGNSWANNTEFLELLGISPDTIDRNGYFPVGTIYIEYSYFQDKGDAANTPGAPLITNDADWNALMSALSGLQTNMDVSPFNLNNGNHVGDYLGQASRNYNYTWGSQRTALFRWNTSPSYGFLDQSVKYHLDLQFNTNTITFITGNNGITSGDARDGVTVDSRTYITGSLIQAPRNLRIPEGYRLGGYFEDANFTIPWDGIGTPLNSNKTVYIKLVPLGNVSIYYHVAQGQGSVSPEGEHFNPITGSAHGSTAAPADGWEFEGWYSDADCTQRVGDQTTFVPTRPDGGYTENQILHYYAKFVRRTTSVTVTKTVTGNMGDQTKSFDFEATVTLGNEPIIPETTAGSTDYTVSPDGTIHFSLSHNGSITIPDLPVGAQVSVTEVADTGFDYSVTINGAASTDHTATITLTANPSTIRFTNNKDGEVLVGVDLDTKPYFLMVAVLVVLTMGLLLSRKRYR